MDLILLIGKSILYLFSCALREVKLNLGQGLGGFTSNAGDNLETFHAFAMRM